MAYVFAHEGGVWSGGFFTVPANITDKYLKLASEAQIKALLLILRNGGSMELPAIASALNIKESAAEEVLDFWVAEGVLSNAETPSEAAPKQPSKEAASESTAAKQAEEYVPKAQAKAGENKAAETKVAAETGQKQETKEAPTSRHLIPPSLSQAEVVMAAKQDKQLAQLLTEAQNVLGNTLRTSEQELIVNMVNFYGLKPAVVMVILQYYKNEKDSGRAIGTSSIQNIAESWAAEGIETLDEADEKCKEMEQSDSFWREIATKSGIKFKTPSESQRKKVLLWRENFSMDMVERAIDIMKDHCASPSFTYLNGILSNWLKKGIKTPEDVQREEEEHSKKKEKPSKDGIKGNATYDIDKIQRDAKEITEFKI